MTADYQLIVRDLNNIRRWNRWEEVFGANVHHFECYPPLAESELIQFEIKFGIRLPVEYRLFILLVGNGGAGPAYGVFRLGEMDDGVGSMKWDSMDGFVGDLKVSFPFCESWNDLNGMPQVESLCDEVQDHLFEAFDQVYFRPLDGAIPICHRGCALRDWLVISGSEAGNVWRDDRADYGGIYPFTLPGKERVTFYQWYCAWLDDVLHMLGTAKDR